MSAPPAIHWLERVGSTQDAAHQLAGEGAPDGLAVAAVQQTQGRGSRGRGWLSPSGGLWLSVICRPPAAGAPQLLSIRVSLAVAAMLSDGDRLPVGIKWPNDLMLNDRKLGGVLSEARWIGDMLGWIVVGVGLNLQNRVPGELRPLAVSLVELGDPRTPADLAAPVTRAVSDAARRTGPLTPDELDQFAARDWLRGRALSGPVAGHADGIAADGGLVVRAPGGTHVVRSGPVVLALPTLHA